MHLNIRCSVSSGDSGDTLRPACLRSLLDDDDVLLRLDLVVFRRVGFAAGDDSGAVVDGLAWKIGSDPSTAAVAATAEDDDNGDGERVSMDNDGDSLASPILV